MTDPTMRRVAIFFGVIAVTLIAIASLAVRNVNQSVAANDWVNQTHALVLELQGVVSTSQAADGALRAFLASGDRRDQAVSRDAFAQAGEHAEIARSLARANPTQSEPCARLALLVARQNELAIEVMAVAGAQGLDRARQLLSGGPALETLREIERQGLRLKAAVMASLAERDTAAYVQAARTRWTVFGGVLLDVLLLGGIAWLLRDDIRARKRAADALRDANASLEKSVAERTAQLTQANARLTAETLEREWTNQALEHQLKYNTLIVDSISDVVFVLTKTLRISRMNPAAVHHTGYQAAELIDQPLATVVELDGPGERGTTLERIAGQSLRDGKDARDYSARVKDREGRVQPMRFNLYPLRDGDKVVGGVVTLQPAPPAASAT